MVSLNLNLAYHEKKLIIKALVKTKGSIVKAYNINVPNGFFMTYRTYLHKINHVHKINTKEIKQKFKQNLAIIG